MTDKYSEGEEFHEVTFEIPKKNKGKDTKELQSIADEIINQYPDARNIRIIPSRMCREPQRLSVVKNDYSYNVWNSKQKSQIIESKKVN